MQGMPPIWKWPAAAVVVVLMAAYAGQAIAEPAGYDECIQNGQCQSSGLPLVVPEIVPVVHSIPANGGILIDSHGWPLHSIEFLDETGRPIAGELIEVEPGKYFSWRPLEPFAEGTLFVFEFIVNGNNFFGSQQLRVDPAWEATVPVGPDPMIGIGGHTDKRCCSASESVQQGRCYDVMQTVYAYARLRLKPTGPMSHVTQFVYQIVGEEEWQADLPRRSLNIDETVDEVCYTVRLRHVLTLEETELPPLCARVGELPELGEIQLDYTDELSLDLCGIPPEEDEGIWCDVNRERCQDVTPPGCDTYRSICTDSAAGTDNVSDSAVTVGDEDAGLSDAGEGVGGNGQRDAASNLAVQDAGGDTEETSVNTGLVPDSSPEQTSYSSDASALPGATPHKDGTGCSCHAAGSRKANFGLVFSVGAVIMLLLSRRRRI